MNYTVDTGKEISTPARDHKARENIVEFSSDFIRSAIRCCVRPPSTGGAWSEMTVPPGATPPSRPPGVVEQYTFMEWVEAV